MKALEHMTYAKYLETDHWRGIRVGEAIRRRERKRVMLRIKIGAAKSRDAGMAKRKKARELYKHMEPLAPDAHKGRGNQTQRGGVAT